MKKISLSFIVLTNLFLTLTPVYGDDQPYDNNLYLDKTDILYPIPESDDVVTTLGKSSKKQLPSWKWSFLVWNLHKGADDTFKPEYLALTLGRDIIMNQEIYLDKNMLDVFQYLPFHMFETGTSFYSGKEKIRTGVANISPVAPVFTQYVRTVNLEPIVATPKLTLITSYPIRFSRKKLTVVNIHGINFVPNEIFHIELERIYRQIKDIPSPLVFAGDFNTWNLERRSILKKYAQKLKLSEAVFLPDNRLTFNGHPLDHFLHTSDIKITKARVDSFYRGSDHKPMTL
jgi:endonuclease/exonuclease/phosphatase (EEP) superfamily protein YafD